MTLLALITEFIFSIIVFIWIIAMLGFADEMHRNRKANLAGKITVILCVSVALFPILCTLWVGWKYYFSATFAEVPFGLWLPVLFLLICIPVCAFFIYLYKKSYDIH